MRKLVVGLVYILVTFCSCQDENSSLGENLVKSSFKNVFTDTCTVDISSIMVDSLETLGDSVCQIGFYNDSVWGKVKASYLAEFTLASFSPDLTNTYVFDSITLNFQPSGHYWGDTLSLQRIWVYPLEKVITYLQGETLYNTSYVPLEETPVCSFTYYPHPAKRENMEIRMPDSFGKQLFDDMLAEKNVFESQEKFRNYLHGLALIPDETGSCVSGFMVSDSSIYMRLYYHILNVTSTESELDFKVNTEYAFTRVEHDRTGTPLEVLSKGGAIFATSSTKTGKRAYLQGLTGIYNSIEFPYLNDLMINGDIVSIENATLYLYPQRGSYGVVNQLPSTLRLYVADDANNTVDQVYDSMGTTIQDGSLTVDDMLGRETYYSFDITSFLQENLGTWGEGRQKLFLVLDNDDFVCTFDQVVFTNDTSQGSGQIRLDIRYKTYDR